MAVRPIGLFDGGSPEARARQARANLRNTARQTAARSMAVSAAEMARLYPGAPAGVVIAAAQAGLDPRSEEVRSLMGRAMLSNPPPDTEQAPKSRGGLMGLVGGLGDVLLEGFDQTTTVAKGVARTAFTAAEGAFDELSNIIRAGGYAGVRAKQGDLDVVGNFWDVFAGSPSAARLAVGELISDPLDPEVDLGEGFFAGGEMAARQKELTDRFEIDGNPISVGRVVANEVSEPGTFAYNALSGVLDGAVLLAADPAEIGLRALSRAGKVRRSFFPVADRGVRARAAERLGDMSGLGSRAGLVDSYRPQVIEGRARQWLDTEAGDLVAKLAEGDDFLATYNFLGRKVRPSAVRDLVDARTPDEVRAVLMGEITEGRMRNKIPAGGRTFLSRKMPQVADARVFDMMPRGRIDFDDIDDGVEQARRWMVNARFDEADQARVLDRLVRSEDRSQMFDVVVRDMFGTLERNLVDEFGVKRSDARKLTTAFASDTDRMRDYGITEMVEQAEAVGITVGEKFERVMSPMLFNQLLDRGIPLPNPRELRRVTSKWAPVLENPAVRVGATALGAIQEQIWKPAVLLRGAWTVRVVGEEQLRIAASGSDSLVSHPLSALAWITGRKGSVDILGKEFGGVRQAMAAAAAGEADEFSAALARGSLGLMDERVLSRYVNAVGTADANYIDGWVNELSTLSNDPVARRIARGRPFDGDGVDRAGIDGIKDWFWKAGEREELAHALPILGTRAGADTYVDFLTRHIDQRVGGHDALRAAIGTGPAAADPRLRKAIADAAEQVPDAARPGQVLVDSMMVKPRNPQLGEIYDRALQAAFNGMMSVPTNKLSRSPFFRQRYWDRATEVAAFADDAAARQIVDNARAAGLDDDMVRRIEASARGGGNLTAEHIDTVSKGFALDETRNLLYDLRERSQLFESMRLITPFGEAWREVVTRWARLGRENPQVLRRAQQTIQGARGSGFFYQNDNGEEMFAYPGSKMVTEALLGVPVKLEGRVAGLSMVGEVMPGFGPAAQIPVAAMLPDAPEFDWVRDLVTPFGDPEATGSIADFFPAWMQKFQTSDWFPVEKTSEQARLFASAMGSTMDSLAMSGDYDLHGPNAPDEAKRLLRDAKTKANGLYWLRGAAQFVAPSAPSPEVMARDPEGRLVVLQELADTFHDYLAEDPDTAEERFLSDFGPGAFLLMQPKTSGVFRVSQVVEDWARQNPDLIENFPRTYAFFGPTPPEDEPFDYDTYARQIARGERVPVSPEERLAEGQHRVARLRMEHARSLVGPAPTPAQRAALAELDDALVARYPGYNPTSFESDLDQVIVEIGRAVSDEKLADNPVARMVRTYLAARDVALQVARQRGRVDFASSQDTQDIRDALRMLAVQIGAREPRFIEVWDRIFDRELRGQEEEEEEEVA